MAFGACSICGNSFEECECKDSLLEPKKRILRKFVGNKEIPSQREDFLKGFNSDFVSCIEKIENELNTKIENSNASLRKQIMAKAMICYLASKKTKS